MKPGGLQPPGVELHNMRTTWSREKDERGPPKQPAKSGLARGIADNRPATAGSPWVAESGAALRRSASAA